MSIARGIGLLGGVKKGDTNLGRAIKPETVPRKIIWRGPRKRLPECLYGFRMMLVSARFPDVVERLEPGVHQFIPVELVWKDKSHIQDMFMFNICNRLDTIDPEASTAGRTESGFAWHPRSGTLVFSEKQIGDHHAWIDQHLHAGHYISDALHDALVEAGITGLEFARDLSTGGE